MNFTNDPDIPPFPFVKPTLPACVIESCGRKSQIKAAKPLTWGVAIEVPLKEAYFPFGTEE